LYTVTLMQRRPSWNNRVCEALLQKIDALQERTASTKATTNLIADAISYGIFKDFVWCKNNPGVRLREQWVPIVIWLYRTDQLCIDPLLLYTVEHIL